MSWHCLPVEGVEFSLPIFLESVRLARLKSTPPLTRLRYAVAGFASIAA